VESLWIRFGAAVRINSVAGRGDPMTESSCGVCGFGSKMFGRYHYRRAGTFLRRAYDKDSR
jgi:hypothetical protein